MDVNKAIRGVFRSDLEFEKFLKWEEENAELIKREIEAEDVQAYRIDALSSQMCVRHRHRHRTLSGGSEQ
jgi:hypothetical protein